MDKSKILIKSKHQWKNQGKINIDRTFTFAHLVHKIQVHSFTKCVKHFLNFAWAKRLSYNRPNLFPLLVNIFKTKFVTDNKVFINYYFAMKLWSSSSTGIHDHPATIRNIKQIPNRIVIFHTQFPSYRTDTDVKL